MNSSDLTLLGRGTGVPRPARRWKTRLALPLVILGAVAALLAYAARDTLTSRIDVWVVPVVAKAGEGGPAPAGAASIVSQAPGWIEPSPYAFIVPALAEGVVREVLVLEGQRIEKDQVVVRLESRDAQLGVRRAEAELGERKAAVEEAGFIAAAAGLRADELRDEINRKRDLVAVGGVPAGEFTRLELRLRGAEQEIAAAKASLAAARASVRTHEVMCEEAALMLERMEVRSPASGIVLSRHVEPGTRIQMSSKSDAMNTTVLRVYAPEKLQVRVDVPMADVARIVEGTSAEVTTEALPESRFRGKVILIGHEASVQRNTVPVKVAIENPSPLLKPEMLAKVRFYSAAPASSVGGSGSSVRLLVSEGAIQSRSGSGASVWLIDSESRAARQEVKVGDSAVDGYVSVSEGLQPGDRLVVDPPASLRPGARVRILGEKGGGVSP